MSLPLFIASRYLTSRSKKTFISLISLMSVLGVAIGVAALVVVMSVYNGVTEETREKILGAAPHVQVVSAVPGAFYKSIGEQRVSEIIGKMPEIESVSPYLYAEVLFSTSRGATGLIVRGLDPSHIASMKMLSRLDSGSADGLSSAAGAQGILVGRDLAERFGLKVGSRVNLMSPAGQKTSAGFAPKLRPFKVTGIFHSGMLEYDSRMAFISLASTRTLMGYPEGHVSGLECFLHNPYEAPAVAQKITDKLGFPFATRNWVDLNANLFAALQMERFGMSIVLLMVILVGSFSIITSLAMLVMEKTRDIAVLMSMGTDVGTVRRIFIYQGLIIGAVGTIAGYVIGIILALLLKKYQFIDLPKGVYLMENLPVSISPTDLLLIGAASILLCFLATLYPARKASQLIPAEALRYE